ncbi:MAG: Rieske 2Fe-2S domain-containing protein [Chitinophagales bacterium]
MKNESRREFLRQAGTVGACVCCMGAISFLSACSTSGKAGASVPSFTETADEVTIPAALFADKNYLIVPAKKYEQPLYITKQPDGSFLALRMYCTHKGCKLNAAADKFVCPCHGSEFSLNGDVTKGPAKTNLISLPVSLDQSNVIVHFS